MAEPSHPPPASSGLVDQTALDAAARYAGDPWLPSHPYFEEAETNIDGLWHGLIRPFLEGCDFASVLDLATGRGRNARLLLPLAGHLTLVDIRPENIAFCRERFGADPRITYLANNGFDLRGVGTGTVSLLYCFDAMVHFDSDVVRSYLAEARRVLRPGGRAFLHHSNYVGGHDWLQAPHCRAFMSKELFAHYAFKAGLGVLRQDVMEWGNVPGLDCVSLLERP